MILRDPIKIQNIEKGYVMKNEEISNLITHYELAKKTAEIVCESGNFTDDRLKAAEQAKEIFSNTIECLKIALEYNKDSNLSTLSEEENG
jgi:hypothetical protein